MDKITIFLPRLKIDRCVLKMNQKASESDWKYFESD